MWTAIIGLIVPIGLKVLEYFLDKSKENAEMMRLFYDFVERTNKEYLNSATMREHAKARMKAILDKEFKESP